MREQRMPRLQTACYGTLKAPSAVAEAVEFTGCFLCGAGYNADFNCLREAEHCFESLESVWLLARRRTAHTRADVVCVPLLHKDTDGRHAQIADVEIESNLPANHWLLRGVKISTSRPLSADAALI